MAGRTGKAGRLLAGLVGLLLAVVVLAKSLAVLAQALRLRATLPEHPGRHLEVKEAFITCALELVLGAALGWWAVSKFRRPKPAPAAV